MNRSGPRWKIDKDSLLQITTASTGRSIVADKPIDMVKANYAYPLVTHQFVDQS